MALLNAAWNEVVRRNSVSVDKTMYNPHLALNGAEVDEADLRRGQRRVYIGPREKARVESNTSLMDRRKVMFPGATGKGKRSSLLPPVSELGQAVQMYC